MEFDFVPETVQQISQLYQQAYSLGTRSTNRFLKI